MTHPKIVGAGLISVDNLFVVRKNGTFGQDSELEGISPIDNLPCRYIGSHGGGSASNTICFLSKMGFDASMLGVAGSDRGAELVYEEFGKFGVNTDFVKRKEGETRQFTHLIFPDHHLFRSECPICRNRFPRSPVLTQQDVLSNSSALKHVFESDVLHVDRANSVTLKLVESAYQHRKVISFDFGYQAALGSYDIASEIIKRTTVLKTSRAAGRTFLSRLKKGSFYELNPNLLICVTTLGDKGAEVAYKSGGKTKSISLEPYRPSPIVDRAGAGDAFHAGILLGLRETLQDRETIASESTVRRALEIAQGFGGLVCTDYGARGYFLGKLGEPDFESAVLSDLDALINNHYKGLPADAEALFSQKRNELLSNDVCGVCGKRFLKQAVPTVYEGRVDSAPWSMSSSFQIGTRSGQLVSSLKGRRVYLVGSGASFSVAILGAIVLNQLTDAIGMATTPYDYVSLSREDSSAILISFGGRNPDIFSALERARDIGSNEIHVITGNQGSELARRAEKIKGTLVHEVSSRVSDAGFVSTSGMLACASTLMGIMSNSFGLDQEIPEFFSLQNLNERFGRAKRETVADFAEISGTLDSINPLHLVALGSGWAWPAVVDFESRITEGAVCTIEISELKNYTHGRYLNAYRNKGSRLFVLLGLPRDTGLVRFLKEKLSKDFPVLSTISELDGPLGAIDLLIRELYLSSELSKRIGLDIARAWSFPRESRGLFSWGPIYSRPTKKIDDFVGPKKAEQSQARIQTKLT